MAVKFLIFIVALSLVYNVQGDQMRCFACENICWEADSGIAKDLTLPLNKTCVNDCRNFPFQSNGKTMSSEKCTDVNENCFTAHALMKYKVKSDGSAFTLRYLRRGCIKECSSQVCDFSKLEDCKLAPHFSKFLSKKIDEEKEKIMNSIKGHFGEETLVQQGMGGEMKCCEGSECNIERDTHVAHTYLRDEL